MSFIKDSPLSLTLRRDDEPRERRSVFVRQPEPAASLARNDAISEKLEQDAVFYHRAARNAADAGAVAAEAERGVEALRSVVTTLEELTAAAATVGANSSTGREIEAEANRLIGEYNRIVSTQTVGDSEVRLEDLDTISIQSGADTHQLFDLGLDGTYSTSVSGTTYTLSGKLLDEVDLSGGDGIREATSLAGLAASRLDRVETGARSNSERTESIQVSSSEIARDLAGPSSYLQREGEQVDALTELLESSRAAQAAQRGYGYGDADATNALEEALEEEQNESAGGTGNGLGRYGRGVKA